VLVDARLLAVTGREPRVEDRVAGLFDLHYLPLCRLACLLLGDSALAEDVVQEAFLRTFAGWKRLRDPERAEQYLRRSVVNLCTSRFRRRGAEQRGNAKFGVGGGDEDASRSWSSDRQDTVVVVLAAVRCLPPRQRMSIVLRYYLDLPEAEVAALMGCTTGTVKSQVAKAKATLAFALREGDPGERDLVEPATPAVADTQIMSLSAVPPELEGGPS
jgi:RNA polymerase sigma-70 factor (sigma-E family)